MKFCWVAAHRDGSFNAQGKLILYSCAFIWNQAREATGRYNNKEGIFTYCDNFHSVNLNILQYHYNLIGISFLSCSCISIEMYF